MAEEKDNVQSEPAPVKGTLLTPEQAGEWGNDTVLVEKKPKTEANVLEEKIEPDEADPPEEKDPPKIEPEEVEDVVEIEDPGTYTPADYSFEVTTYTEDKDGNLIKPKTVKVTSIQQWEELLADDPNLGSSLAVNKAFRAAQKMESNLESDQKTHDAKKAVYDKAVAEQAQSEAVTNTWANEINYLEENGDLPKVPAKFKNVAWVGVDADKEALKDESVKAQIDLLEYMRKENIKRRKLGLSDLGPEGAFSRRALDTRKKTSDENKEKADNARKVAGARVAGSSPNPVTVAPKGIAVGVGGSLRDLGNTSWN